MIRAFCLWLLLALPAHATQDAWPALHDVIGVTPDDVLNVRAGPSSDTPIIATLAPDAVDIELIAPNDAYTWALVNAGEQSGWVSLRFMQRQPGQWLGAIPKVRSCYGTEPFWGLTLTDAGTFTFDRAGEGAQTGHVLSVLASENRRDRYAMSLSSSGAAAVLSYAACNDGMSDRQFGITVDLLINGSFVSGCCTLAP
ncbi:peptide-binding protein [Oceaniglobus ichthyenteri]|uniref:peptide-binding protein n=1 Tax=Oceaniglobus ichthyenteri TaxID=2136177 RepID=UPI000D384711|nr:peptide-binding protein [Oceaniglobus ichthyenteri]